MIGFFLINSFLPESKLDSEKLLFLDELDGYSSANLDRFIFHSNHEKLPNFRKEGDCYVVESFSQQYTAQVEAAVLKIRPWSDSGYWTFEMKYQFADRNSLKYFNDQGLLSCGHSSYIEEWYRNTSNGIEHGFVLNQDLDPEEDFVELRLDVETDLVGKEDNSNIVFYNYKGSEKMSYRKLVSYDAVGNYLPSHMTWNTSTKQIVISVDDSSAVYPIVIDPLISTKVKELGDVVNIPGGALSYQFGHDLDIEGDTLVISAIGEETNTNIFNRGAVYVFTKNEGGSNNWGLTQKIIANDAKRGDEFGSSLDLAGEILVVGARFADSQVGTDTGKVYVYRRNGEGVWNFEKLLESPVAQTGGWFGADVAVSGDDLVVGESQFGASQINNGLAHVYGRNEGGVNNWGLVLSIQPTVDEVGGGFGAELDIEENLIAVGKLTLNSSGKMANGGVSFFERNRGGPNNWGLSQKILPSESAKNQFFGSSLQLNGDYLAVGAPGLPRVVTGLFTSNSVGAAYIFKKKSTGSWQEEAQIKASDGKKLDKFGSAVAIHQNCLYVGALSHTPANAQLETGAVYIYDKDANSSVWQFSSKVDEDTAAGGGASYGFSLSLSNKHVVIGAPASSEVASLRGTAFLYSLQNSQYNNWLSNNFTSQELGQSNLEETLWGVSADPDGDSIINIEEAYFNTDPRASSSIDMYADYQNSKLSVSYSISSETNGVTAEPFWSKNLLQWYESGQGPESDLRNLDVSDLSGVRKIEMNPSSGANGFIQLQYIHD